MVFCFIQNFFFGQHKSQNIYFFCRAKHEIFFQNVTLDFMSKTLNQIIFFSSTKIRIFFSATLRIRIFFQKKTITPPLQVKWSFPQNYKNYSLMGKMGLSLIDSDLLYRVVRLYNQKSFKCRKRVKHNIQTTCNLKTECTIHKGMTI